MKKVGFVGLVLLCCVVLVHAEDGFQGRPITNNISFPTGFTLQRGEFMVGLGSIGFGITDRVQVGTNILLYLFQVYNLDIKATLLSSDSMTLSAGLDLNHFNLDVFGADTGFTSLSPFVALSTKMTDNTTLHLGGRYAFFNGSEDIENAEVTSTLSGTSIFTGLDYSFSNRTKFLLETGYDTTFEGFRVGGAVLWGWKTFRLKLGVNYYNPKGSGGFTMPVIGLWWRFNG